MRILLMLSAPVLVLLNACAANQMNMGSQQAKTTATGAAGGATAVDANSALERCDRPVGTAAFIEDTGSQWYGVLTSQYKLPSTTMVLRQLAQQSNLLPESPNRVAPAKPACDLARPSCRRFSSLQNKLAVTAAKLRPVRTARVR